MRIFRKKPQPFTVELANVPIEVNALYAQIKHFCRDYLSDGRAVYSVSVSRADIRRERKLSRQQAKREGQPLLRFRASYLETLALCRKVTEKLLENNVLLFHGAAIALNGKVYLFTASSGTGKTTHCNLWLKNVPDCHILNGDKPLLKFCNDGIFACGSPWMGKENYGTNETLPLAAVCILERDKTNRICQTDIRDGFASLLNQCHIPEGKGNFLKAVQMLKTLSSVPMFRLGCNMEEEAAFVSYNAMVKK